MNALEQRNIQFIIFYKRNYPHKKTGWPFIKLFLFWILFCRPNGSMVHGNVEVGVVCGQMCATLQKSHNLPWPAGGSGTGHTVHSPAAWSQLSSAATLRPSLWQRLCPGPGMGALSRRLAKYIIQLYILGGFYRLWATLSSNLRTPIKTSACSCVHSFHLDNFS